MYKNLITLFTIFIAVLFFIACDDELLKEAGENDTPTPAAEPSNAHADVYLSSTNTKVTGLMNTKKKDDDDPSVVGVTITFDKFYVHRTSAGEESGWNPIELSETTIDVMDIDSMNALITGGDIPEGQYNILRFYITGAVISTDDGELHTAAISSNKLDINLHFEAGGGDEVEIFLQMDVDKSVKKQGKNPVSYRLQPVIHLVKVDKE
jgi:hypothetical protein